MPGVCLNVISSVAVEFLEMQSLLARVCLRKSGRAHFSGFEKKEEWKKPFSHYFPLTRRILKLLPWWRCRSCLLCHSELTQRTLPYFARVPSERREWQFLSQFFTHSKAYLLNGVTMGLVSSTHSPDFQRVNWCLYASIFVRFHCGGGERVSEWAWRPRDYRWGMSWSSLKRVMCKGNLSHKRACFITNTSYVGA